MTKSAEAKTCDPGTDEFLSTKDTFSAFILIASHLQKYLLDWIHQRINPAPTTR